MYCKFSIFPVLWMYVVGMHLWRMPLNQLSLYSGDSAFSKHVFVASSAIVSLYFFVWVVNIMEYYVDREWHWYVLVLWIRRCIHGDDRSKAWQPSWCSLRWFRYTLCTLWEAASIAGGSPQSRIVSFSWTLFSTYLLNPPKGNLRWQWEKSWFGNLKCL